MVNLKHKIIILCILILCLVIVECLSYLLQPDNLTIETSPSSVMISKEPTQNTPLPTTPPIQKEPEIEICAGVSDFKYYQLISNQLSSSFNLSTKWTTNSLNHLLYKEQNRYPRTLHEYARFKCKNNTLYWHNMGGKNKNQYFESWFIYYFYLLFFTNNNSAYIDDFDIVIYIADGSVAKNKKLIHA